MAKSLSKTHQGTYALLGLLLLGTALFLTTHARHVIAGDVDADAARTQQGDSSGGKRLGLRLLSFYPSASGSLYFEPTAGEKFIEDASRHLCAARIVVARNSFVFDDACEACDRGRR